MIFESTVTLGAILQTITLGFFIIGGWARIKRDIDLVKNDIQNLQGSNKHFSKAFEQLSTILTQIAVQDNRILNVERRHDELAHGRGFIEDRP